MLPIRRLSAVILALTVAIAACVDATGLDHVLDEVTDEVTDQVTDEVPFDADASATDLQAVQGAFAATVFESFAISSDDFTLVADNGAVPVALLQASLGAATAGSRWEAAAVAQAFAAGPASGPLLPVDFLGHTYARDVDGIYRLDETRTGAPTNGVRFILYEVDPVTGTSGTTEIGYVDLLDESYELAYVARVVVVTSDVERINYALSAVLGTQSETFTVFGFISDGTVRVDVDLSMSFFEDGLISVVTVEHLFSVPSRDFAVEAIVVFAFDKAAGEIEFDVDASFMQGDHTVTVVGVMNVDDFLSENGIFEIHVDELLFAVITIIDDTVTIQNGTGTELTIEELQAVESIFDGLWDIFEEERFDDFVSPVEGLFDATGSVGPA